MARTLPALSPLTTRNVAAEQKKRLDSLLDLHAGLQDIVDQPELPPPVAPPSGLPPFTPGPSGTGTFYDTLRHGTADQFEPGAVTGPAAEVALARQAQQAGGGQIPSGGVGAPRQLTPLPAIEKALQVSSIPAQVGAEVGLQALGPLGTPPGESYLAQNMPTLNPQTLLERHARRPGLQQLGTEAIFDPFNVVGELPKAGRALRAAGKAAVELVPEEAKVALASERGAVQLPSRAGLTLGPAEPLELHEPSLTPGIPRRPDYYEPKGFTHVVTDAQGNTVATIELRLAEDLVKPGITAQINIAGHATNQIGPGPIRDVMRQLLEAHPEIQRFVGSRVTGSRSRLPLQSPRSIMSEVEIPREAIEQAVPLEAALPPPGPPPPPTTVKTIPASPESPIPSVHVETAPDGVESVLPPALPVDPIGLRALPVTLSKAAQIRNLVRAQLSKPALGPFAMKPVYEHELAVGALNNKQVTARVIENLAGAAEQRYAAQLHAAFAFDKDNLIPALEGVSSMAGGRPGLSTIAARLPEYLPHLSAEQLALMIRIRDEFAPYDDLFKALGGEHGMAQDVMEGGFYIPRGRAALADAIEEARVFGRGGGGGKGGFERARQLESMAAGVKAGYVYDPPAEVLGDYIRQIGGRINDIHTADAFKHYTDAQGALVGTTAKMRMLAAHPEMVAAMDALKGRVARLKALGMRLDDRQDFAVDSFLLDPEADDINAVRDALTIPVKSGPNVGARIGEVEALRRETVAAIDEMKPAYQAAMKSAQTPRGRLPIDLPGLQGYRFPTALANSATAIMKSDGIVQSPAARVVLGLMRNFKTTLDNSAMTIQGLVGMANDPVNGAKAIGVSFRSWADPHVYGAFLTHFDDAGRLVREMRSADWAKAGVQIGGVRLEEYTQLPKALQNVPLVKQANRAFANFGATLRLAHADRLLARELRTRTFAEIKASGDVERIAESVNRMTGYSAGKAGGSLGDLAFFAPRFLQSQLEQVSKAGRGLLPGATLDARIARKEMLQLVATGVALTYFGNTIQGRKTDFRPIVNGRVNPNLLALRVGGEDTQLLGPWASLANFIINVGTGHPGTALRSKASPLTAAAWDFLSGSDFQGRRTRDDAMEVAATLLQNFVPITATQTAQSIGKSQGGLAEKVGIAARVNVGVRENPLSLTDTRQIVADEYAKAGRIASGDYTKLSTGEQRLVNADPRVTDYVARNPHITPPGPDAAQMKGQVDAANQRLEGDFLTKAANLHGPALFKEVNDFLQDHRTTSQAIYGQNETTLAKTVDDQWAAAYWSVPLDFHNNIPDYATWDAARNQVLAGAKEAGVDPAYITGREPGQYRGLRFGSPEVRRLVNEVQDAQEQTREYWRTPDRVLDGAPAQLQDLYHAWQYADNQGAYTKAFPFLLRIEQRVKTVKEAERRADPALDHTLQQWYGLAPLKAHR